MKAADDIRVVLPRRVKRNERMAERARQTHNAHEQDFREVRRQPLAAKALADAVASINARRALTGATGKPETVVERIDAIEKAWVPDPSMTPAQLIYEKGKERERAQRQSRKENMRVGQVQADVDRISDIGALCFIAPYDPEKKEGKRLPHHERAAREFKCRYEALYGQGSPAIDPSRIQVDSSITAHDSGVAFRIDNGAKLTLALAHLGEAGSDRVIAAVVLCIPAGSGADRMPSGQLNQRQVRAGIDAFLADLDRLAEHWGYISKAA